MAQTERHMQTEQLIGRLSADLVPVRPLAAPTLRALLWLGIVFALMGIAVWVLADWPAFLARIAVPRRAAQCIAIATTAITAVIAAFQCAIPGRSRLWAALPLPPLAAWLAASGLGCLQNGWSLHGPGGFVGESPHCFAFIVAVSIPLAVGLFAVLRRARPIAPLAVALPGALGVAALAAFALQFFHPFDVTVIDLVFHFAAVAIVVLGAVALRGRALASASPRVARSQPHP